MKRLDIDFAPRKEWLVPWVLACAAAGLIAGGVAVRSRALDRAATEAQARSGELAARTLSLRTAADKASAAQAADPRAARLRTIDRQLRQDWNPAFATVENLQLPGTRLVQMSIDAATEAIRVEYEVENVAQAAALTADMNAGLAASAWRLEAVTGGSASGEKMRASWTARLSALR